jgi:hypothetical protein
MPYRRLPNTDTARIRAMKTALELGKEIPPQKLSFSVKSVLKLQKLLPQFEHDIHLYRQARISRNKKNKSYNEILKKARLYLSHFIRVMNMAIIRGDLPAETRAFYELEINELTVPFLNSENELLSWGRRIIEGEEYRIRKGGNPVTNPSVAVVKIRFENFVEALESHNILEKKTLELTDQINNIRKEADEIILQLWNEIEEKHSTLPEEVRKKRNEEYGLVYFYRKSELNKMKTDFAK